MSDKKHGKTKSKYVKKKISYCLTYGKNTKNEDIKGVELENKMRRQKSTCVACDSKISTFFKPIKPIKPLKSKKQFSQITKTCKHIVCM